MLLVPLVPLVLLVLLVRLVVLCSSIDPQLMQSKEYNNDIRARALNFREAQEEYY